LCREYSAPETAPLDSPHYSQSFTVYHFLDTVCEHISTASMQFQLWLLGYLMMAKNGHWRHKNIKTEMLLSMWYTKKGRNRRTYCYNEKI